MSELANKENNIGTIGNRESRTMPLYTMHVWWIWERIFPSKVSPMNDADLAIFEQVCVIYPTIPILIGDKAHYFFIYFHAMLSFDASLFVAWKGDYLVIPQKDS